MNWPSHPILSGHSVQLVPLNKNHKPELLEAARDGELWNLWYTSVPSPLTIEDYIEKALQQEKDGASQPYVVVDKNSNKIIGSTRYCNMDHINQRLEIGYTWYAQKYQRTGVNTECKYLLLQQAFEVYKVIAVEFRTNWFNYKSRSAISRIGAKQDGILRNHRIDHEGNLRDTVVFSIIDSEWDRVKRSLKYQMGRYK